MQADLGRPALAVVERLVQLRRVLGVVLLGVSLAACHDGVTTIPTATFVCRSG